MQTIWSNTFDPYPCSRRWFTWAYIKSAAVRQSLSQTHLLLTTFTDRSIGNAIGQANSEYPLLDHKANHFKCPDVLLDSIFWIQTALLPLVHLATFILVVTFGYSIRLQEHNLSRQLLSWLCWLIPYNPTSWGQEQASSSVKGNFRGLIHGFKENFCNSIKLVDTKTFWILYGSNRGWDIWT